VAAPPRTPSTFPEGLAIVSNATEPTATMLMPFCPSGIYSE
jgi:hypothetical protein